MAFSAPDDIPNTGRQTATVAHQLTAENIGGGWWDRWPPGMATFFSGMAVTGLKEYGWRDGSSFFQPGMSGQVKGAYPDEEGKAKQMQLVVNPFDVMSRFYT